MDDAQTTIAGDRDPLDVRPRTSVVDPGVEEFPLRVVPDWDVQKKRADTLCRLIDRHLDYEAGARSLRVREQFAPGDLCPEQRIQLITDAEGVMRAFRCDSGSPEECCSPSG
jgi:hypothetical protein